MSILATVAIALVAALLGGLAGMLYQDARWRKRKRRSPVPADVAPAAPDAEVADLRRENDDLRREKKELDYLLHKQAPSAPPRKAKLRAAPAPATPPVPAPPAEAQPPEAQSLYASAVPGGYLADGQFSLQPMGRMPLAVRPDPLDATRASFTLSPEVDKSWLIEAGLDRLRDYFDFEPLTDWPSAVAAAEAGRLLREGEGWRVAPGGKARLDVR